MAINVWEKKCQRKTPYFAFPYYPLDQVGQPIAPPSTQEEKEGEEDASSLSSAPLLPTALHLAAFYGLEKLARFLVKHGANVNMKCSVGPVMMMSIDGDGEAAVVASSSAGDVGGGGEEYSVLKLTQLCAEKVSE